MGFEKTILDWRQTSTGHSSEGGSPLVTRTNLSASRVCSPTVVLLHKKGPRHRRKIYANSLWLYSYYAQSSPSKNKNINYIFTYPRIFRCLSSGRICYNTRNKLTKNTLKNCFIVLRPYGFVFKTYQSIDAIAFVGCKIRKGRERFLFYKKKEWQIFIFSLMLITHFSKVWREEVEVGMEKMNLEWHSAPHILVRL